MYTCQAGFKLAKIIFLLTFFSSSVNILEYTIFMHICKSTRQSIRVRQWMLKKVTKEHLKISDVISFRFEQGGTFNANKLQWVAKIKCFQPAFSPCSILSYTYLPDKSSKNTNFCRPFFKNYLPGFPLPEKRFQMLLSDTEGSLWCEHSQISDSCPFFPLGISCAILNLLFKDPSPSCTSTDSMHFLGSLTESGMFWKAVTGSHANPRRKEALVRLPAPYCLDWVRE